MEVFNFLKKDENCEIGSLEYYDLKKLIELINNYKLVYRRKLPVQLDTTFGVEIEYLEEAPFKEAILRGWKRHEEPTLTLGTGMEIVSPRLRNRQDDWLALYYMCNTIDQYGFRGEEAGSHIHVAGSSLQSNTRYWYNLVLLYAAYEDVIYRFGLGEYLNLRDSANYYAKPENNTLIEYLNEYFDFYRPFRLKRTPLRNIMYNRNYGINISNYKDTCRNEEKSTIEFRLFNGTFDPVIWQNNINLVLNMIRYAKSRDYNEALVRNRLAYLDYSTYQNIYPIKAIEFADLIFQNNADKVYFLRQYFKDMETTKYNLKLVKANKFTKI